MKSPKFSPYRFLLVVLFCLPFLFLFSPELVYVVLRRLIILHLLACLPVLGIGLFLLPEHALIFLIQLLDLRDRTLDLGKSFCY